MMRAMQNQISWVRCRTTHLQSKCASARINRSAESGLNLRTNSFVVACALILQLIFVRHSNRTHCPAGLAGALNESFQCARKNCFCFGKNVSDFPTMGRSAVVIWTATRMNMITHVYNPADDRALE